MVPASQSDRLARVTELLTPPSPISSPTREMTPLHQTNSAAGRNPPSTIPTPPHSIQDDPPPYNQVLEEIQRERSQQEGNVPPSGPRRP